MPRKTIQYASITIPDFLCVLGRIWTSSAFILGFVCTLALPAQADSVYVVNGNNQFGTVDLGTGAFQQIGPNTPEGEAGLVQASNGSLLTLTYSGNLDSINPTTGITTVIGPTSLGDCSSPASSCGPNSASALAALGGTIYATDFANNLYRVDALTGKATLIGPTGIPAVPFRPGAMNPDGSFNFFDAGLFSVNGRLYTTFDAGTFNPVSSVNTPVIAPNLYQIDPSTGGATLVGPTDLGLDALVYVNGAVYAFNDVTSQVVTLNVANGNTSFVSNFDPAAGVIDGAAATPEPGSIALVVFGMIGLAVYRRRRRAV
jgi:hypothetical protein